MLWLSNENIVTKNIIVANNGCFKNLSIMRDNLSKKRVYDLVKITKEERDKVCFSIHSDDWIHEYIDRGVKGSKRVYEIEHYRNPYFVILQMIKEALTVDYRKKFINNIDLSRLLCVNTSYDKKSLEENLSRLEEMLEKGKFEDEYSPQEFKIFEYYIRYVLKMFHLSETERYIVEDDYVNRILNNGAIENVSQNLRYDVLSMMSIAQNNQRVVDLTMRIKQRKK